MCLLFQNFYVIAINVTTRLLMEELNGIGLSNNKMFVLY